MKGIPQKNLLGGIPLTRVLKGLSVHKSSPTDGRLPDTTRYVLQWLPCHTPGVIESALGLVGPTSVFL